MDTFSVSLLTLPQGTVTISVTDASDPAQTVVNSSLLTFTADDYAQPKTVTVSAVDDDAPEDDPHVTTIVLTAASGADAGYDGLEDSIEVSIAENDCGAWGVHWADLNRDCVVDIGDLAQVAADWLLCTTPHEPGCVDMR
ncbi:MAG TPA: hypothetical protein ENN87_01800 [Phycisphaerales bacterium]|nr:hypothetical protein [Phycisphaerales bacterium]